jgi:hypothetical protein
VITTTSYAANDSEVFTIIDKSSDNQSLTLIGNLKHDHLAFYEALQPGKVYNIAAGVGLLSRNVKVIGAEYGKQNSDLYGFRILASDYSTYNSDGVLLYYKGFTRLSDVEFVHPGQFSRESGDDAKYGILLSNLGSYNSSRPTHVTNCAFHHGYSAAIGIFSSSGIPIENNVIYYTIDYALFIQGDSNIIRGNLVTTNFWASTFITWEAQFDLDYWGAIDVHLADSVVLENNLVAGAERIGIYFKGGLCDGDSLGPDLVHSIKNNTVYSAFGGVVMLPSFYLYQLDCVSISGFTVFKSVHYGIYYQNNQSLVVDSNILIDNQVGLLGIVLQPSSLFHEIGNKTITVSNTMIVGNSPFLNCTTDLKPNDLNFQLAKTIKAIGAGTTSTGKIGIVWPNFLNAPNGAPFKPWFAL